MLTQLPKSGDWVTLTWISRVEAEIARSFPSSGDEPPHVKYREQDILRRLNCDTFEEAEKLRDEIAAMVNAAHASDELTASEALYGFSGWLTSRDERVVASATDDAAPWAKLVDEFCKANNLQEPRDGWPHNLVHPQEAEGQSDAHD